MMILRIKTPAPQLDQTTASTLMSGLAAIVRSPLLRITTLASSIAQIGMGALPVILVAALEPSSQGARAGLLLAVMAAGAIVGSLMWTVRPAPLKAASALIGATFGFTGVCIAILAFVDLISVVSLVLFAVPGAASAFAFGATLLIRDAIATAQERAQVFSLAAGAKVTAGTLGAAVAGVILPLPNPLIWIGAGPILAGLTMAAFRIWRHKSD